MPPPDDDDASIEGDLDVVIGEDPTVTVEEDLATDAVISEEDVTEIVADPDAEIEDDFQVEVVDEADVIVIPDDSGPPGPPGPQGPPGPGGGNTDDGFF